MTLPATISSIDVDYLRAQFPILSTTVHGGKPLVYLDHAATSQKPQCVIDAIASYYTTTNSNVHRGAHALAAKATEAYEYARHTVAAFLGAASPSEIVFTKGTTEAVNLVAATVAHRLQPGDEIVLTEMEHHANIVPWQLMAQQRGAVIRVIPVTDSGELDMQAAASLIGPATKIVSAVHVSNTLGTVNPVAQLCAMAGSVGALSFIDGAQAVLHDPIDVAALGCDFYAFSAHKLFAPMGLGVLYGRYHVLESLPPYQGGGSMIDSVSFDGTTFNAPPMRFEAGTPNVEAAVGLTTAIEWFAAVDPDWRRHHDQSITAYALDAIGGIDGLTVYGNAAHRVGILSFTVEGTHAADVGTLLDAMGVAVRVGHHCTQPLMRRFGVTSTIRASFSVTTTAHEVDVFAAALTKAVGMLR